MCLSVFKAHLPCNPKKPAKKAAEKAKKDQEVAAIKAK